MIKNTILLAVIFGFLSSCVGDHRVYRPCQNQPDSVVYLSSDGVERVFQFREPTRVSIYFQDGDDATNATYPSFESGSSGFFIDNFIYIPPNFRTIERWRRKDTQCSLLFQIDDGRYVISCSDTIYPDSVIYFLFSEEMGVSFIGYSPIATGSEQGEAFFKLNSPIGFAAECE